MSQDERDSQMVDLNLARIVRRDGNEQQWIFFVEKDGQRAFPIVIGSNEASEIDRVVREVEPERPLTHQLAYDAISALGAKLDSIDIVDLVKNTFYAQLVLRRNGDEKTLVDARPSDAVALALRAGCRIRVKESVLEEVRTDRSGPDPLPEDPPAEDEDAE